MMTRSLLLKGLAGVAALGGAAGGLVVYRKEIFGGGKAPEEPNSEDVSNFSQKELIDKVGLNCGLTDGETEVNGTKDCTVKDNGTINIKKREQEEEGVTFTANGSTKLKVSKSDEVRADGGEKYTKKLKFVVDSGDINLSKKDGGGGGGTLTHFQKLEQFETYEVFLRDKKFYLRRKTEAKEEKIKALGLPTGEGKCSLPESGDSSCTLTIEEAKKVKFEGQNGQQITLSGDSVTLKVTKMGDSDTDFGENKYRFTFTFPGDVTINSKQLKAKIPYDFKIKKQANSNNLTLEQAWTDNNVFTKKAGLECTSGSTDGCSISTADPKLNVKVGKQKKEGIGSKSGSGKIKMETDQPGYNQGLKFTITEGDVTISDGTASGTGSDITKLEELETYEITEEKGKYYLTRKTSKEDGIRSSLSIPEECFTATGGSCTLSQDAFKAINFEGKSSPTSSGNITLKISKVTNTTDFPLGYKFTFNTTSEATIATGNTIKANVPTDFKIKKQEGKVSLEKAWSNFSFAEKVGLSCTGQSGEECCNKSDASGQLNVKKGTETKTGISSIDTSSSSKIKVEKDQAGYNQGLKFTITGGNVTLTGGSGGNFTTLDEYETYEIKEEGDKYYLTRKTEAIETIESQLGLKEAGCSLSGASSTCTLTTEKLQKINFSEKESPSIASNGTATLTITSGANSTDFPNGYKFTLQSTTGDITIKTTDNVVKKGISTDFKIKKGASGSSLSLEKAWTMESLGKKVGLKCSNGGNNECSIDETNSNKLKVWQKDKYDTDVKQTTLSKGTSTNGCSASGKIKVTKDQAGYNQGFKFKIEDGNIVLTGSTGNDDSSKVHRLGEFETYEIKEESDKQWYLVRKERADKFIKDQLKLKDAGCSESENFPHGASGSTYCREIDLQKLKQINFEGKNGHDSSWPTTGSIDVELTIKEDSSLPGGFKFTFTNNSSSSVCLPTGTSNGKFSLNSSSNVEYKIKKKGSGDTTTLTLEKHNGGSNSCSS